MSFTFPADSNNKAGAVRPTADGDNFYVPTVAFQSDGVTPIDQNSRLPVNVSTLTLPFRDDFNGAALSSNWNVKQQGAGQGVTVSNSTLQITTGTTANAATIIQSLFSAPIPLRVWFIYTLSQRIANQTFFLELVNQNGDMVAGWQLDGTSAGTAEYYTTNSGNQNLSAATNIVASSTYSILEIEASVDEFTFVSRYVDSTNQKTYTYVRTRLIPDPQQQYYVRIRAVNGSTAPASSTTLTIDAICLQEYNELSAEIVGGRGSTSANQAIATYSTGGNVAVSGAISNYNYLNNYTESLAALSANGSANGSGKSPGSSYGKFRGAAYSDQSGTLYIDCSRDNVNWRLGVASIAVPANTPTQLEVPTVYPYYRVRYVNGATAQTTFELLSSIVAM